MAKRSSKRKRRAQRVNSYNTTRKKTRVLRDMDIIRRLNREVPRLKKDIIQDLRRFHPELTTPYLLSNGKTADIKVRRPYTRYEKLSFMNPVKAMVCTRRKLRKRMIFRYLNKSGKGGAGRRLKLKLTPRVMNPTSYIKC